MTTKLRLLRPDWLKPPSLPTKNSDTWRYGSATAEKRDLRLDLLRGFAVFAMVVDHIGGPSWLYAITGGNRFFVSAAEAFVLISGVVAGIVYGGRARRLGWRAVVPQLLLRAWTLYVLAVWLAISTAVLTSIFGLPRAAAFEASPARFFWEVVTAQRTYYLVDVMLLYAFLMVLAPLAFGLLLRGRWWLLAVLSWGIWAAYQLFPGILQLPWPIIDNPVFKLAAWQVLFFTGLILGFERKRLAPRLCRLRSPLRDSWIVPLAVVFSGLIWLHVTNGVALASLTGGDTAALLDRWFDKSALPPARLASCAVVFALAWAVVTRWWRPIYVATRWLLLPLGQAALYAYAAHLFLVPTIQALAISISGDDYPALHPGFNAAIQAAALLVLLVLTRARFLSALVSPLGASPLIRADVRLQGIARPLWRPSEALTSILLVALVSASLSVPTMRYGGSGMASSAGEDRAGARGAAIQPVATVTAPRSVAGSARDSASVGTDTGAPGGAVSRSGHESADRETSSIMDMGKGMDREQPGGYLEDAEFYSPVLDRVMPYGIYFPAGYDNSSGRYPVLYMLHGIGGHYSEWVGYGLVSTAEELTAASEIEPMIIVFPQGDVSFWVNHAGPGGERWGDYLALDLVPHIDATYRTIPARESRAIGGLSMGAFGAASLTLTHPDVFGVAGIHSLTLRSGSDVPEFLGGPEDYARIDPLELAAAAEPEVWPRIWIDIGQEDDWRPKVEGFQQLLQARGVEHDYQVLPGIHAPEYWTEHVHVYLNFYTHALLR